jgi:hypothetical protein
MTKVKSMITASSSRVRGIREILAYCGWVVAFLVYVARQSSNLSDHPMLNAQVQPSKATDTHTLLVPATKEQVEDLSAKLLQQHQVLTEQQQKTLLALLDETLKDFARKQDIDAMLNAKLDGIQRQLDSAALENMPAKNYVATTTSGDDPMFQRSLLNNPPIPPTAGTLTNTSDMTPFLNFKRFGNLGATDAEDYDILHHYFWGQENGIVMELGALDGDHYSISKNFLRYKWHRLLVEANPAWAQKGPTKSPDATYVHAAICDPTKLPVVHYLRERRRGAGASNGIVEFMSPGFLKKFHGQIYEATQHGTMFNAINWTEWNSLEGRKSYVDEVPCLGLNTIFNHLGIKKINFFMLDVEGGELNILQSLDFDSIQFDVLIVETEPFSDTLRPEGYAQKVIDFVQSKGYVFDRNKSRNSWFHHPSFVPVKDPALDVA